MGYESTMHLDAKIKSTSVRAVKEALKTRRGPGLKSLGYILKVVVLLPDRFLTLKASKDGLDRYCAFEDGTVPALSGKWYEAERFAKWLKQHAEKGGRIVLHSDEGDGEAWGWEFDGRGRMRALQLIPFEEWS